MGYTPLISCFSFELFEILVVNKLFIEYKILVAVVALKIK